MAIFGRYTARRRLRRAAEESLKIPSFTSPVDCTPWVTGGLWPAELSMVTPETAPLVKHLKSDLERIVNSANDDLKNIRCAGLVEATRQTEEARVISEARTYAVRRVESAVRHMHGLKSPVPAQLRTATEFEESESTARFKIAPPKPAPITEARVAAPVPETSEPARLIRSRHRLEPDDGRPEPEPATGMPVQPAPRHTVESADTEVLKDLSALLRDMEASASPSAPPPTPPAPPAAVDDSELTQVLPAVVPVEPSPPVETDSQRLQRLLKFVARQEPGLRWAVGIRADGSTLLVSDLAHGWVPSGMALPADVTLLEPARRSGNAAALLGNTTHLMTYAPGDPLGWATDGDATTTSSRPRALPAIDDLGWLVGEATHWRDGLPRMVNTLAKAAAAGTGIVDAEIDILRVYLDTARYQILAQYPDVDEGLLLNCLLLAATEALAVGDTVGATYHFAWFQTLSAPLASGWKP